MKRRRVNTKVGDIFETVSTKKGVRYLHLIAIDINDLNSDAVAVYDNKGKGVRSVEEIVLLPIEFYSHTTIARGVRDGLWRKIGNAKALRLERFVYKYYRSEDDAVEGGGVMAHLFPPKAHWDVWTIGEEETHRVSLEKGHLIPAETGGVVPADDIIYRIEHGKSRFKLDWPTD